MAFLARMTGAYVEEFLQVFAAVLLVPFHPSAELNLVESGRGFGTKTVPSKSV